MSTARVSPTRRGVYHYVSRIPHDGYQWLLMDIFISEHCIFSLCGLQPGQHGVSHAVIRLKSCKSERAVQRLLGLDVQVKVLTIGSDVTIHDKVVDVLRDPKVRFMGKIPKRFRSTYRNCVFSIPNFNWDLFEELPFKVFNHLLESSTCNYYWPQSLVVEDDDM